LDKKQAFCDQMKFKAILKLKCDQPEWKISIKSEMIPIIPTKIMSNHSIYNMQHKKNHEHRISFGIANTSFKLNITRCDPNCHTNLEQS
jgi:hypothetical protein